MKVIEETFVKGQSRKEVITVGKKKFIRISSSSGIDWRRYKTNHQVKKSEFENLEQEYQKRFPIHFSPDPHFNRQNMSFSGITTIHQLVTAPSLSVDEVKKKMIKFMKENSSKLAVVKYVKEISGWGLVESKNFFEAYEKFVEAQKIVEAGFGETKK